MRADNDHLIKITQLLWCTVGHENRGLHIWERLMLESTITTAQTLCYVLFMRIWSKNTDLKDIKQSLSRDNRKCLIAYQSYFIVWNQAS